MSLKSKIIGAVRKKAVKSVAKTHNKNSGESSKGGALAKTADFLKQASKEISVSDVADIAGMATGTSATIGATMLAGQTILDAKNTTDIISKEFEQLRGEGKITQDILDAVLCENKSKLVKACDEVLEAEKIGKPLRYLTEDEIKSALSIRKAITKAVVHKILG